MEEQVGTEVEGRLAQGPEPVVLLGAEDGFAGVDGAAQELAAGAAAIEQQAQQRGFADLFRGGQERDGAFGNDALPDPRNEISLLLTAGVGMANGGVCGRLAYMGGYRVGVVDVKLARAMQSIRSIVINRGVRMQSAVGVGARVCV